MRIKEEDLEQFAKVFKTLTNGKYKLAVISKDEIDYLYDLSIPGEDGFDLLVQKTLMASMNDVLLNKRIAEVLPKQLPYEDSEKTNNIDVSGNSYIWKNISKKPQ